MITNKDYTSLRQISAILITPIITGLLIALCLLMWQENPNKAEFTIPFSIGMTVSLGLLLGLPPYLWLRWKKNYSRKAIIKVGVAIGTFVGFCISSITSQIGFILFGVVFGFIASLIFHKIHGVIDNQRKATSKQLYLTLNFSLALISLVILSFIVYRNVAVYFHVKAQSEIICNWLNSQTITEKPSVGPLAHKKLEYLKNKYSGGFDCRIKEPLPSFANFHDKAIVIYHNNVNKLGLHYEFGGGIRQAFIAHYSHLWTPKDSGENEYSNF